LRIAPAVIAALSACLLFAGCSSIDAQSARPGPSSDGRAGASSREEAYTTFVESMLAGDTDLMTQVTRAPGSLGSADDIRNEYFGLAEPLTTPVALEVVESLELDETEEDLGVRLRVFETASGRAVGSIIVYTVEENGRFWVSAAAHSTP